LNNNAYNASVDTNAHDLKTMHVLSQ